MVEYQEAISIQNVLKIYKSDMDVYALNDVSLTINKNELNNSNQTKTNQNQKIINPN